MNNITINNQKISDGELNRRFYFALQALPSLKNNVKSIVHLQGF